MSNNRGNVPTRPSFPGYILIGKLKRDFDYAETSTIWEAIRRKDGARVALKVPIPNYRKEVEGEAELLSNLRHAGVVSCVDVARSSCGNLALVMPLHPYRLPWCFLTPADEAWVSDFMSKLMSSIAYLHESGVVHGDLRLDNIVMDSMLNPVLVDFGQAHGLTVPPRPPVTAAENATPAIIHGSAETCALDDIYACDALARNLLTGETLTMLGQSMLGTRTLHLSVKPRLPRSLAHWQDFVDGALAVEAKDRFQSVKEMLSALPLH